MSLYAAVTFAPVQGFIEKSRKLRDLYGASLILSHLSSKLICAARCQGAEVISPGLPNFTQGMPNRILVKGDFPEEVAHKALLEAWGEVLEQCRTWLERTVGEFCRSYNQNNDDIKEFCQLQSQDSNFYTWKQEWDKWKNYTWELFWGTGNTAELAQKDLEQRKLSRRWTAINWVGESSSISGADAIAYPYFFRS